MSASPDDEYEYVEVEVSDDEDGDDDDDSGEDEYEYIEVEVDDDDDEEEEEVKAVPVAAAKAAEKPSAADKRKAEKVRLASALRTACRVGDEDGVVDLLLQAADPLVKDADGWTAVKHAKVNGRYVCFRLALVPKKELDPRKGPAVKAKLRSALLAASAEAKAFLRNKEKKESLKKAKAARRQLAKSKHIATISPMHDASISKKPAAAAAVAGGGGGGILKQPTAEALSPPAAPAPPMSPALRKQQRKEEQTRLASNLRTACRVGDHSGVAKLLSIGANPADKDSVLWFADAIKHAKINGRWEIARLLENHIKEAKLLETPAQVKEREREEMRLELSLHPPSKWALYRDKLLHGTDGTVVLERDGSCAASAWGCLKASGSSTASVVCCCFTNAHQGGFCQRVGVTTLKTLGWIIFIFYVWAICDTSYEARYCFDNVFNHPAKTAFGQRIRHIGFIGDSICLNDIYRRKLTLKLQAHHPAKVFIPVDACIGGSNVTFMNERADRDLLGVPNLEAIFLQWDSDASDLWRWTKPKPMGYIKGDPRYDNNTLYYLPPSQATQAAYEANLVKLLKRFLQKTPNVVLSGPAIGGSENPRGRSVLDPQYDVFAEINKRACASLNVTFIDLRTKLYALLPPGWSAPPNFETRLGGPGGKITVDGEHFNDVARDMILEEYMEYLYEWFPGDDDVSAEDGATQASRARLRKRRDEAPLPKDYFSPTLYLANGGNKDHL